MRLALKIAVVLLLAFGVLALARVQLRVQQRLAEAEADARENQQLLVSALAPGIARTFRIEGAEAAEYEIRYAARHQERRRLRLVQLDAEDGRNAPAVERARIRVAADAPLSSHVIERSGGARVLHTYAFIPIGLEGGPAYALEASEHLPARAALHARLLREEATAMGVLVFATALLVFLVGGLLVGRPLTQLVEHMERVGAGDLDSRVSIQQRDELGALATAMNRMTERLSHSQAEAEAQHAARIEALKQLRHSERLATIGKLSAGLAHELGTPLNVIKGRAQLIEEEGDPETTAAHVRSIHAQVDRMTKLMRGLLDFSRAGSGKPQARRELDLDEVVSEGLLLVQMAAKERHVELRRVSDGPVAVLGAARPLEQVLTNLLMNALDASEPGSAVEVGCDHAPDGRARLWVEDHGCGIPEAQLDRLFEPFFTTKSAKQGTGLGLAIVDGIIQEHDGTIEVDSTPGQGTRFTVFLPTPSRLERAG